MGDVILRWRKAPRRDEKTGLSEGGGCCFGGGMREFQLPLAPAPAEEVPWETMHSPVINIWCVLTYIFEFRHSTRRAKCQPYDTVRQQFWQQYLKQYDTDDTHRISHIEFTSMLGSLSLTLSAKTINSSFRIFTRHGKKPREDELTINETAVS